MGSAMALVEVASLSHLLEAAVLCCGISDDFVIIGLFISHRADIVDVGDIDGDRISLEIL